MGRRGFTLVELLAAMAVFVIVGSMGMYVLAVQNRSWKTESDKTVVQMMAKGTLDELTRAVRMTGSGLPDGAGGMKVYGSGNERATFVMNEDGGADTVQGWNWNRTTKRLSIAVNDATRFGYLGYARLNLKVPSAGLHAASGVSVQSFTLGVVDWAVSSGGCGDSIVLDVTSLQNAPYNWNLVGDIQGMVNSLVQNIDSLTYRKSNDTLYLKQNIQPETVYALGIDTLRFQYFHPVDGWRDSLSPTAPANAVQKVRIRLVMRTRNVDSKLLSSDPSSRGYHFSKMETEVGLRTSALVNQ